MRNRILWLLSAVAVLLIILPLGDIKQDTSSAVIPSPQVSSVDRSSTARQASLEMPILFIENQGQADSSIAYYAMAGKQTVYLTPQSIGFDFIRYTAAPEQQDTSQMEIAQRQAERLVTSIDFLGANSAPAIEGRNKSRGVVNYLIGNDPAKWHTDIPTYTEVVYTDIYPGIDLRLYSQDSTLRYDFVVKPGASVDSIALAYRGVEKIAVDSGDLVVTTAFGDLRQSRPYIYQQINDTTVTVEGGFKLLASQNGYGFEVMSYDSSYPLVIDPVLGYSSYFGGTDNEYANDVEFIGSYAYITGHTASDNTSFPLYPSDVYDSVFGGGSVLFPHDAFVAKIDTSAAGSNSLVYSTYLGGSGSDYGNAIRVLDGQAYVAGSTSSTDFPVTGNATQGSLGGGGPNGDMFLTRLSADGKSLVYSTYLGGSGSDSAHSLYIGSATSVYIAGQTSSTDLHGTVTDYYGQPYGGGGLPDAAVAKINTDSGSLWFSCYFGGSSNDEAYGIAMTENNCPVIVGTTRSSDLPVTTNAYDSSLNGVTDAFVARLNALPSANPLFSTYLGGSSTDSAKGLYSKSSTLTAYLTGTTSSDTGFPTTSNAFQPSYPGSISSLSCGFVTVMDIPIASSGSCNLIYSSYFGSTSKQVYATDLAVSSSGDTYYYVYITGYINDPVVGGYSLPTKYPFQQFSAGGIYDCFVAKFNPNLSGNDSLIFSSYLGGAGDDIAYGIAANSSDEVCVVGECGSGFPVTSANAYQSSFQGGTGFNPSDGFVTTLIKLDTTTTITSDNPDPSAFGQSVAFTASVTAASGTPTGSVEFFNNGSSMGTAALSGGSATLNYSGLAVGTHSNITATYSGDTSYNTSTSSAITHTVNKANTTTTITSDNPDPSAFGQSVAFTASVAASAPGSGTPTGNVEFFNGATSLGTAALSGGSATLNYSGLAAGTYSNITAQYLGDTNFNTSNSAAISHTVNKADTTVTITLDAPDPSVYGQNVTFTALVAATPPGAGTPTGNVEFFDGATSMGTSALGATAQATIVFDPGSVGAHSITAQYAGDTNFNGNTSAVESHTVNKADSITTITSDTPDPSVYGQSVTFTATVAPDLPGSTDIPTGNVEFFDGATSLGTGALDGSGQASLSTSSLSVGSHNITAQYSGSSNYYGSTSAAEPHTVNKADNTTTINSDDPDPSVFGQSVAFIASVTSASGTPTGSVEFFNGAASLGTTTISSGSAALNYSSLAVGTSDNITAQYLGDTNFNTSTSAAISHTVNKADTTTILSSSANPSTHGQSVTFTATVTADAPGSGTPTGTVTFKDGTTALGTGTLGSPATFRISTLTPGRHDITAEYNGDSNFNTSTSSILGQTVALSSQAPRGSSSPPPSRLPSPNIYLLNIDVSPGQAQAGQPVNVLANVVNSGTASGTYNVVLTTNGKMEQQRTIEVSPGSAYPVRFTMVKSQPGTYEVAVNGQKSSFTIAGESTTPGSSTNGAESTKPASPISGAMIAIIAAGLLVAAFLIYMLITYVRSRRGYY